MNEKELLQKLATQVKELNATIAETRSKGMVINLYDNSGTGSVSRETLRVKVSKEVFDSNQDQHLTS